MKRRKFLKKSALALGTTPLMFQGANVLGFNQNTSFSSLTGSDQILILVQLNGGNDGLNTLIPLDQIENLTTHRGNILIPENKILSVTDSIGFHPSLTGFKEMYDNGNLNIVQNVGYPNQNRSHFSSIDIWHTASNAEDVYKETDGWIGRYFDKFFPGFPESFPNEEFPDPFSISIGDIPHATCQGSNGNYSMSVHNVNNFFYLSEDFENSSNDCNSEKLSFLRTSNLQSNAYFQRLTESAAIGNSLSTKYNDDRLSNYFKIIAQLISGGLKTRVFVVNYGEFDTHADQVLPSDTSLGNLIS